MNPLVVRLAAIVVFCAALASGCDDQADDLDFVPPAERPILFRFERFSSAARIDGGEVDLKSLEGRVVLLDLFGTWCPPCRRTAPLLVSLYERFHAQGLEIIGLAFEQAADEAQARREVEAYRDEFAVPYILALGPGVVWDELHEKTGILGAVPTILLVDRQGVVRDLFEGLPSGHEAILADRIERLLAEPAVPVPRQPQ